MSCAPHQLRWGQTWPCEKEFFDLAQSDYRVIPVVRRILTDGFTPISIYTHLCAGRPGTFILESAHSQGGWARWSFIGVNSLAVLEARENNARWTGTIPAGISTSGPLMELLAQALQILQTDPLPGLPPLTSGIVGAVGWDTVFAWEPNLRRNVEKNPPNLPTTVINLVSDLVVIDHRDGGAYLIANAINMNGEDTGVKEAYLDAVARLDKLQSQISNTVGIAPLVESGENSTIPTKGSLDKREFTGIITRAKKEIVDGEVFQIVLSRKETIEAAIDPITTYRVLRTINPSQYMYLLNFATEDVNNPDLCSVFSIVGSSPETLVKADNNFVTTYPIAGSRPRGSTEREDRELTENLLADPKELAEHTMLVDLARNDLSKVCVPGTVKVEELMHVMKFSHVLHICSTVVGARRPAIPSVDIMQATFPAGTLSGAPKPRAIELIEQFETEDRGFYGGVVGYFDFAQNLDLAIAIRTAVITPESASVQAGAGIVADSVPEKEFQEAVNKAKASLNALQKARNMEISTGKLIAEEK